MSITLGGITLFSTATHKLPLEAEYDYAPQDITFYGVKGSVSIDDAEHGRDIIVDATFSGYATRATLKAALELVDARKTTLNDRTLVIVAGADTLTYLHVSFRGFRRDGTAYYDGSGVNLWRQDGTFVFRQLQRTA
jgi:hypothetical protein